MPKKETNGSPREWAEIRNFKPSDFACKCERCRSRGVPISMDLVKKLDMIQEAVGLPVTVKFGVRCQAAQDKKNKGPSVSPHVPHGKDMVGTAVDILCPDKIFRHRVLEAAVVAKIGGIGIGPNFLHLEVDHPEGNVCWVYGR